ncbi:hypothetical protein LCGC14_1591060 [marine sediment metagenome]|uniref:Uncharacterized protein n=1 Tax=marine sediment metagenome TaxID=412755 RepID=A0A0F9LEC2_9ZZZZ
MSDVLFYGEANGKRLFQSDTGHQDVDQAIAFLAESDPVAPAGVGGESIFTGLVCVFLHTMACTVVVTPIVDGVELETQSIVLGSEGTRTRVQVELGLSIPITHSAVERGRCAPQGTWFQVRLAITAIATGDLIVEGVALEQEVVTEGISTQAFTPA